MYFEICQNILPCPQEAQLIDSMSYYRHTNPIPSNWLHLSFQGLGRSF